ncbi:DUF6301 family protein [Nocardia sp. 004]|uniref:DUF6301 family protein n=1 Tax=Nocardia sp. 004 TaxID=3385978 RepID=UPI0039A0C276
MYADLDGAAALARIATGFDWTWTLEDVPRFCAITGWKIVIRDKLGIEFATDFDVRRPQANLFTDKGMAPELAAAGEEIENISITVADLTAASHSSTEAEVVECCGLVGQRLITELGPPRRRVYETDQKLIWDLSKVSIRLYPVTNAVILGFVNPAFQEWIEKQAELDDIAPVKAGGAFHVQC